MHVNPNSNKIYTLLAISNTPTCKLYILSKDKIIYLYYDLKL